MVASDKMLYFVANRDCLVHVAIAAALLPAYSRVAWYTGSAEMPLHVDGKMVLFVDPPATWAPAIEDLANRNTVWQYGGFVPMNVSRADDNLFAHISRQMGLLAYPLNPTFHTLTLTMLNERPTDLAIAVFTQLREECGANANSMQIMRDMWNMSDVGMTTYVRQAAIVAHMNRLQVCRTVPSRLVPGIYGNALVAITTVMVQDVLCVLYYKAAVMGDVNLVVVIVPSVDGDPVRVEWRWRGTIPSPEYERWIQEQEIEATVAGHFTLTTDDYLDWIHSFRGSLLYRLLSFMKSV